MVISNSKGNSFTEHRTARAAAKFNELHNVLTDQSINKRTRKKMLESCVMTRLTYGTQAWFPNEQELWKLKTSWFQCLPNMVKGGWKRIFIPDGTEDEELDADYGYAYSNEKIQKIIGTQPLENCIKSQYLKYIGHVCRAENSRLTKIHFSLNQPRPSSGTLGSKFLLY